MPDGKPTLCFIGFGEAGQAIAAGLRETGVERIAAWDILFPQAEGEKLKRAAATIGVRCASSAAEAVRDADIVVSAVTAAASVDAAQSVTAHLAGKPFFLDINSVSPAASRKRRSSSAARRATSMSPWSPLFIRRGIERRCCSPVPMPRPPRQFCTLST